MSTFQHIKGTFDILPDAYTIGDTRIAAAHEWHHVESVLRDVMTRHNLEEIRTPMLEPTELVARGVGEHTDIVSKEMFAFERRGTQYVLRPEITAPVTRAFLEHHLEQRGGVQKLFYIGPCFRAEQPQKGRYRQFHQFGVEIIGADDPRADAETIAVMVAAYRAFGIEGARLRINTLGEPEHRAAFRDALVDYLTPYKDELSETSQRRLDTNPLRILDTKVEHEQTLLRDAPTLREHVDAEALAHYDTVKQHLSDLDIAFDEDPMLVRGLDYYSHTAFELEHDALGAQSALAGGGRYDGLAAELGHDGPLPACGFAAGMERLFLALDALDYDYPEAETPRVFFAALGDEAEAWVFKTVHALRQHGIHAAHDLKGRSLKAQMREANRQDAPYTVIIGGNELADGAAQVKTMATGEQTAVSFENLADYLSTPPAA